MKKIWLPGATLFAFLLAASPTPAQDIRAVLENPPGGPISGIGLVSGWAFTEDQEEDLEILLRIDGLTRDSIDIPCCSARADVDNAVPGAPDNTGFGLLFNYAELPAGPHTIGVDIRSSDFIDDLTGDADRVVIDRSVVIVRPGNTNFLTSVNFSGASCSISPAGNEVIINNVQFGSASGTITASLQAAYETSLQSLVIDEVSGAPAITRFIANLNGAQETPRVRTSATGAATLTLNSDNSLTCIVTTTDLADAVAAHIHLAPAGVAGGIIVPLAGGPPTWSCPSTQLTAEQLTALREGNLYVNVHTPDNPGGEARGQIVVASGS